MFFTGDAGHTDCDLSRSRSEEPDLWVQAEQHRFGIASPFMCFLHFTQYLTLSTLKEKVPHLYKRGIFNTIAKRTGASFEFSVCQN